jgi:hypothetical protein
MATATILLSERGAPQVEAAVPGPVSSGLSGGWNNAITVTGAVVDGIVSAIPVLIIAALGVCLLALGAALDAADSARDSLISPRVESAAPIVFRPPTSTGLL